MIRPKCKNHNYVLTHYRRLKYSRQLMVPLLSVFGFLILYHCYTLKGTPGLDKD